MKTPNWKQLQDLVAQELKELDPHARSTKGSGNSGEKGDVNNSVGLNIECKDENKLNVFQDKYLQKCIEEIPLHSDKIGILVTRNKEGKIRVHMDFQDFLELFKKGYDK